MSALATVMTGLSWELGAIALGVAALLAAAMAAIQSWRVQPRDGVAARMDRVAGRPESAPILVGGREGTKAGAWLTRLAGPLAALARPTRHEELSKLRTALVQAGLRSKHAMEAFLAGKLVLAAAATLFFLEINSRLAGGLRFPVVGGGALVVCAAAFFLPNLWLGRLTKRRQLRIRRGLPEAMDLLVTCVEAGLGLDAALARVAQELKLIAPLLSAELNMTFLETKAGIARRESFRRLAERTGVDDLRQLAAVLVQTEIFGTSVARALRAHGDGMRIIRTQNAERKAAMVGVKMTFPLVLCILPCLVAVVLGPAIVSIMTNMLDKGL